MLNRYTTIFLATCILLATSLFTAKAGKYFYKSKDLQAIIIEVNVLQSSLQNQRKGFAEKELETRNQKVSLNYRDKFFQIEFSAINAIDTNRTVFRYKLKGLDEEWIYAGRNHFANYYNLLPGEYHFVVQAANKKGNWSKKEANLSIYINPPFYYTWWFITLCFALAMFAFIYYYDRRFLRVTKQKQILEQLVKERTDKITLQTKELIKQKETAEKEKQRADSLLLNILPSETVEELKTKGKASARSYRLSTVMFTDFVGFTRISEKMRPQELVAELDRSFSKFDEIIEKYNVEKIKTMGDAYMCAGGVPIRNKSNPFDVVLAGLEIQRYMNEQKQLKINEGKGYWELRIGIHTGELVAGVIGTKRFAYDIWGDTVNVANRLESSGQAGKVNISGVTYDIIKEFFDCTYRGKFHVKNKGEIDMYFVDHIKRNLSLDEEGIEPNDTFHQKLAYQLYSKFNYKKAEQYILEQLEKGLKENYTYHGIHHTIDVRDAVERIATAEKVTDEELFILKTAALFHDSGFLQQYDNNEPIGAEKAKNLLPEFGYNDAQIRLICSLILATSIPQKAITQLEKIICDADLDYLGRDDFDAISDTLMNELITEGKINNRKEWDAIQVKFLSKHQYYTDYSKSVREPKKLLKLNEILKRFERDEY